MSALSYRDAGTGRDAAAPPGPAGAPARPLVELEHVSLSYGRGRRATPALNDISLRVAQGEFLALVGPSGCGKSTILKLVGDLLRPSAGYVFVGGREAGARGARIGMAFQNPTLLPWLRVRDNVMLPLKIVRPFRDRYRALRRTEYRDRADALLEQVGLAGFADRYPWQLSGGMLQRASLCRALIHDPTLLLLDEPFGALDQFTREDLWETLQALWQAHRPTVLLVTHDLREAAFLATRVCVMSARPGRLVDDSPVDLPRPRSIEQTYGPDCVALMQRLRGLIGHGRTAAPAPAPAPMAREAGR